jgi:hypothetical protein
MRFMILEIAAANNNNNRPECQTHLTSFVEKSDAHGCHGLNAEGIERSASSVARRAELRQSCAHETYPRLSPPHFRFSSLRSLFRRRQHSATGADGLLNLGFEDGTLRTGRRRVRRSRSNR